MSCAVLSGSAGSLVWETSCLIFYWGKYCGRDMDITVAAIEKGVVV